MIKKIISGGQTGADRAALDVAIELKISHGGWLPKGRKTEEGPLPEKYQLVEMTTDSYERRTHQNVIASHGTLLISHGKLTGGSAHTKRLAKVHHRPCLHIDLDQTCAFLAAAKIINWVYQYGIEVLNSAGPRASKDLEIYNATVEVLRTVMDMAGVELHTPFSFQRHSPPITK